MNEQYKYNLKKLFELCYCNELKIQFKNKPEYLHNGSSLATMRFIKILLAFSIALTTLTGDYIVSRSKYSGSQLFRAVVDNLTHAAVGLLSSLAFFSHDLNVSREVALYNTILCTIVSSLIDVDHFILAKSFYLKDIATLKQRGICHCTTIWTVFILLLLIYSYIFKKSNIFLTSWILLLAFMSHHIRDGNRRGLWLYPFGSTPPLNDYVYVISLVILPFVLVSAYKCVKMPKYGVEYTIV